MARREFATKLYRRVCLFVLFFIASAASFNGYHDKWHFREAGTAGETFGEAVPEHVFDFSRMVDGTASRPYVYRQLLPAIANGLERVTSRQFKDGLFIRFQQQVSNTRYFESPLGSDPVYFFRYLVVYEASFVFVLLAVYAMYGTCRALGFTTGASVFTPVIMILLMPYFLTGGGYFYDYPELAFMALALWMALRFDWWWLLPVVAFATWNKESFLLFTITLYPILRLRVSRRVAILGTSSLALCCALVYLAIRARYGHNPGGSVLVTWRDQITQLMDPIFYVAKRDTTYGVIALRACTVLPMMLIAWTAWRSWSKLPKFMKRHVQIAAGINIPLYFLFCAPGEVRDLSLLYMSFVTLLAIQLAMALQAIGPMERSAGPSQSSFSG